MKLKGFTLVETLVSIVLIVSIASTFMLLFAQSRQRNNIDLVKASLIIKEKTLLTLNDKSFFEETYKYDQFSIKKSSELFQQTKDLIKLSFDVYDKDGKNILHTDELVVYKKNSDEKISK